MKSLKKRENIITAVIILAVLALAMVLDITLPGYHIAIKVLKKGAVYALVAVSMNLLNGFTGLFSLGQAGFMLLGAYSYAVLCIPVAKRAGVYQYFDGGLVQFSLPEALGKLPGMLLALLIGGLIAALLAFLIGLPVPEIRLSGHCHIGFCRDSARVLPVECAGPHHQRLQPAQELS